MELRKEWEKGRSDRTMGSVNDVYGGKSGGKRSKKNLEATATGTPLPHATFLHEERAT